MKNFTILVCLLFVTLGWQTQAQVTLSAGDIAITGFTADGTDQVSFVALTDIPAGTVINLTDNGWISGSGFRANEQTTTFTFETAATCGNEFISTGLTGLSSGGDQVLIYQTDMSGNPTFIAAINFDSAGWSNATNSNTSALPPGLVNGVTANDLGETDNAVYECGEATSGPAMSQNDWLTTINDANNWFETNTSGVVVLPSGCPITCSMEPEPEGCDELFFSEYIEGSGSNKCLEIYNPTDAPIFLDAGYYLILYANGNTTGTFINLTGTIASGDVHVICNPSATSAFTDEADQLSGSIQHNGNDVYELYRNESIIDAIGQVGNGSTFGANVTLVRKAEVTSGDTDSSDPFDASIEWDSYASNTSTFLGEHMSICQEEEPLMCSITSINVLSTGVCDDGGTPYVDDDTALATVEVNFENAPEVGNLIVEIGDAQIIVPANSLIGSTSTTIMLTIPADGQLFSVTAAFDADALCALTVTGGTAPDPCSELTACDFLFFSEYVEGSNFNKCLEIYNPTDFDVNLADYGIFLSFNGGSFENTVPLSGVVESGDVFVICHTAASAEFLALADATSDDLNFNGDDAVLLQDANGTIDAIGQRGVDPGSEWFNNGVGTRDETLRRQFFVTEGDNNPNDAFDPSQEWESSPQNTSFGLGYHGSTCQPSLPIGVNPAGVDCSDFDVAVDESGEFTLATTCAPVNPYQDRQAFAFRELCGSFSSVSAQVDVTSTGFAGLQYRASLANNSPRVFLYTNGNNRVYWQIRSVAGTPYQTTSRFAFNINYLKIERSGNTYRGFVSPDGVNYQWLFTSSLNLGTCPLAGAAVHSLQNGTLAVGTFSDLAFSGGIDLQVDNTVPTAFAAGPATQLDIAPNPAADYISVAWPTTWEGEGMLEIRDLNGRLLQQRKVDLANGSQHVDLDSQLAAGIYLLTVHGEQETLTKRFVKTQ